MLQASTIKKYLTQLAETAPYVNSKYCPEQTKHNRTYMDQLDQWYTNTINKIQAQVNAERQFGTTTNTHGLTLTEIWDSLKAKWQAFWLEVSCYKSACPFTHYTQTLPNKAIINTPPHACKHAG